MSDDARPAQPFHRRQLVRVAMAAGGVAFAGGFVTSDGFDSSILGWLPRVAFSVAAIVLFLIVSEIRSERRIARLEQGIYAHLEAIDQRLEERIRNAVYAEGYVDGVQRRMPPEGRHLRSV